MIGTSRTIYGEKSSAVMAISVEIANGYMLNGTDPTHAT
jgi:hypothetical protein